MAGTFLSLDFNRRLHQRAPPQRPRGIHSAQETRTADRSLLHNRGGSAACTRKVGGKEGRGVGRGRAGHSSLHGRGGHKQHARRVEDKEGRVDERLHEGSCRWTARSGLPGSQIADLWVAPWLYTIYRKELVITALKLLGEGTCSSQRGIRGQGDAAAGLKVGPQGGGEGEWSHEGPSRDMSVQGLDEGWQLKEEADTAIWRENKHASECGIGKNMQLGGS